MTNLRRPVEIGIRVCPVLADDGRGWVPPKICENYVFIGKDAFHFNNTLPFHCDQNTVFRTVVKPKLSYLLSGGDIAVVVYGELGAGKSYTIFGPGFNCILSETEFGILPRTIRELFTILTKWKNNGNFSFQIRLSFFELFGYKMRDLLGHANEQSVGSDDLILNEKDQLVIRDLTEVVCHDVSLAFTCIKIGLKRRLVEKDSLTDLSHCFCTVHVDQEWQQQGQIVKKSSRAVFVDLSSTKQHIHVVIPKDCTVSIQDYTAQSALAAITNVSPMEGFTEWPADVMKPSLFKLLQDLLYGSIQAVLVYCTLPGIDSPEMIQNILLAQNVRCESYKSLHGLTPSDSDVVVSSQSMEEQHRRNTSPATPKNDVINQGTTQPNVSGLDMAARQCAALLTSAENLFQRLLNYGHLECEEQQIREWLEWRQECKDNFIGLCNTVMASSHAQLERIDEVSESSSCIGDSENSKEFIATEASSVSCQGGAVKKMEKENVNTSSAFRTDCQSCVALYKFIKSVECECDNESRGTTLENSKVHTVTDRNLAAEPDPYFINQEIYYSSSSDESSGEEEEEEEGDDDEEEDDDSDDEGGGDEEEGEGSDDEEETGGSGDNSDDDSRQHDKGDDNDEQDDEEDEDEDVDDELLKNVSKPDFVEKLDSMICKLKQNVDVAIDNGGIDGEEPQDDEPSAFQQVLAPKHGRRKSILPVENMKCLDGVNSNEYSENGAEVLHLLEKREEEEDIHGAHERMALCVEDKTISKLNSRKEMGPYDEIRLLSTVNDAKQSQIGLVNLDLEGATKRIEELQHTIRIKEQFIEEMIHNSEARTNAKARFQKKHCRLEEEYFKARSQLAKAEKALNDGNNLSLQKEVEKYKALALYYEKRLHDIEMIKQIPGDSAKKVLELENSLQNSRRKMHKLKNKLKREEEYKNSLERELREDQKRIKELEQKFQSSKVKGKEEEESSESERLKWIAEEETRLMNLQESSQRLQEQLHEQQMILDKRELFLKEKLCSEKSMAKSLLDVSARISHLEQVLKEKSTNLEQVSDAEMKEALRLEISNLRKTRDILLEQRCNLDAKFNKDKMLTTVEERKFLECDEAIEAIDATIEYKNELLCGRRDLNSENSNDGEQGETMLMARLMKLSPMELKTLLCKYFKKVVDLRESGRKMEAQIADLDQQTEAQSWKIHALTNALQQAHLESERRLVVAQREHQEKLHLMFRHFAEETSGQSSSGPSEDKWRSQNKALKQRIVEMEALLYNSKSSGQQKTPPANALNIPQQNLKQLQGSSVAHTTKVTRQKNKLIIQQSKTKKQSK